jgi:hypothetical protein
MTCKADEKHGKNWAVLNDEGVTRVRISLTSFVDGGFQAAVHAGYVVFQTGMFCKRVVNSENV